VDKNFSNPTEVFDEIWDLLSEGAEKSSSAFHLAFIATSAENIPKLRTVVLRKVIKNEHALVFHTDKRSHKVNEIKINPNVSWLFYSKENKIQLRLEGTAFPHVDDALADAQWRHSRLLSRRCYLTEPAPGTETPGPHIGIPDDLAKRTPSEEESESGRENFCVVKTKIKHIEWLYLRSNGHLRARFFLGQDGYKANWLVP